MIDLAQVNNEIDNFFTESDPRNKAVLVNLVLTCYTARKFDRKVSDGVARHNKASNEAGRYNKCLIDVEKYIKPIKKLHGEMRTAHYHLTLPFMDNGSRILALSNFDKYCSTMNDLEEKVDRKVREFIDVYPQAKEEAKKFLGDMYREEDYPHEKQIAQKFSCDYYMSPLPDIDDFRVQISEQMKAEAGERIKSALDDAMNDAWTRLRAKVSDIAEKLPAFERGDIRTFKSTLITNLVDLLDVMPGLNIYDDPKLEELARLSESLTRHDAETLKTKEDIRKDVAREATDIMNKMNFHLMS